jgi:hypothetical protein
MSKAEEKKQKREGCFLLHWILFYYYKPQGQEHNIVEVWFGLVWFRERKLRGRSCVAVMRERERERERWLRKKKGGWAWMGIQLDMEYCEVDYEKKKKQATTRRRRLLLLFAIQVALLFV